MVKSYAIQNKLLIVMYIFLRFQLNIRFKCHVHLILIITHVYFSTIYIELVSLKSRYLENIPYTRFTCIYFVQNWNIHYSSQNLVSPSWNLQRCYLFMAPAKTDIIIVSKYAGFFNGISLIDIARFIKFKILYYSNNVE